MLNPIICAHMSLMSCNLEAAEVLHQGASSTKDAHQCSGVRLAVRGLNTDCQGFYSQPASS